MGEQGPANIQSASAEPRPAYFPVAIYLAALLLRLIPVLLTPQLGIGLDDMFQYDMLARSLASGNGFRWYAPTDLAQLAPYLHIDMASVALDPRGMLTTFRAPLYPSFVALIYAVFGVGPGRFIAVRLAQAALGATLAPLTYFVARRVLRPDGRDANGEGGERMARAAAIIVSVYPMFLIFPLALATENLFIPLVAASVLVLLKLADAPNALDVRPSGGGREAVLALLTGVLLGLAALTRSVILPFAGLAAVWIWVALRKTRPAVLSALALLITTAPWIVRNSLLSHKLTGIETSMGYNLYIGYHPQSTGTFTFGPSLDLLSILDDGMRDQVGTQRAIAFIRDDPQRFPYLALRRLGYFFDVELRAFTYFYVNDFLGAISPPILVLILAVLALPFVVIAVSAAWGAAFLPRRPETTLLALLLAAYLIPHVFILSEERFHLVLIPFFAICSANAWRRGTLAVGSSRARIAVAALVCLLLLANWGFQLAGNWTTLTQMLGPHGNQLYLPY